MLKQIKRLLLLLTIVLIANGTIAQIIEAEYFVDTDPGEGNATPMIAEDGALDNVIESVLKDGISIATPGIHMIGIRVKNDSLHWGPVFKTIVSVEDAITAPDVNVAQAEFFWDTDPGEGSGNVMLAFDGNFNNALETIFQSGITLPAAGIHKLCVRVKDMDNTWGPVYSTVVSVENLATIPDIHITSAEVFWDSDPGEGNGTPLIVFDGAYDEALEKATENLAIPAPGMHKLSVRVQDMYANWGPVYTTVVSVENMLVPPSVNITAGEFFWDADPGEGNGTALLAFDGNFNNAVEVLMKSGISLPSTGIHTANIRVMDASFNWGPLFTTIVSIEEQSSPRPFYVTSAEFYWDTDPGEGNGIPLIAFDGSFGSAIETVLESGIALPTVGIHKLCVRAQDADNNWGSVFSWIISIEEPLTPPEIMVLEAEAYWDTDPGEGNGIPLMAVDGNFDNAIEQLSQSIVTGSLDEGHHTLSVRVKDANETWGPVFTSVVFIDPCATHPEPSLVANGPTTICYGDSLELVAESGFESYTWVVGDTDLGETAESIYVTEGGYYKVIVTDANGCPGVSDTIILDVNPLNPEITINGETDLCEGESVMFDAGGPYQSYIWSDGSTSSAITVDATGSYSVTISNDGCTKTPDAIDVTVNPLPSIPTITADGPTSFCTGDSVVLTASPATEYLWSNGATTQSIAVHFSGDYTVSAINAYGCSATSFETTVTVTSPSATITASGDGNICDGETISLNAGTGYTQYEWSTGETTQIISVDVAGAYTVTATNVACVGVSDPFNVFVYANPPQPVISANDVTSFCEGDSVVLTSSAAFDNLWSNGDTASSTVVYSTGNYFVTNVNAYGCYATSAVEVVDVTTTNTDLTITGGSTICQGDTSIISAMSGYDSYLWSNGATDNFIEAADDGTYNVTITNNACTAVAADVILNVVAAPAIPVITYSGDLDICDGETVELVSSVADSYLWSTGETTQSITVASNGSFFVNAFNTAACASTSVPVSISVYNNPQPDILYDGSLAFCSGDSVVLTSSATSGNLWSTGAMTQEITVHNSGNYYVTADNGGGCYASSDTITIDVTQVNPQIVALGSTEFCQGDTLVLDAGASYDAYIWSNGQTSQTVNITQQGGYTVSVTLDGCTKPSAAIQVTVFELPDQPIITTTDTNICNGSSTTLVAGSADAYLWSNGETSQTISVNSAGCYTVQISDINGCTAISECKNITVEPSPAVPVISVDGPLTFCEGDSVVLTSSLAESYAWSTGEDYRDISVYTSGAYNVTVYNAEGCSAVSQNTIVTVLPAQDIPVINYTGSTEFCEGESLDLSTGSAYALQWSDGSTDQNVNVSSTGSYYVVATNSDGCTATSDVVDVIVNAAPGVPVVSYSTPLEFCEGDSVLLTSSIADAYQWSNGETSREITAFASELFNVTIYNQFGCASTSSNIEVTVNQNPDEPSITLLYGDTLITDEADAYQWYYDGLPVVGGDTVFIKAPASGTYMVEITDTNGCSASSEAFVFTVIAERFEADYAVNAYPNPFTDYVTFDLTIPKDNKYVSFEMYDVSGKLVRSKYNITSHSFKINRNELPSGMYIFRLLNDENKQFGDGTLIVQ